MEIFLSFITLLGILITASIAFLTWSRGLKSQILLKNLIKRLL